ncbi:MAG: hypothetical protein ACLP5V_11580 [Candidatus Bathyarchaeia archaeon]
MRRVTLGSKTYLYVWTAILLAAIVLLLLSWAKSYPLHQEYSTLPFLSSVYWTYWTSYLIFAIAFWRIATTNHSAPVKWGAAVGFFMLVNSLAYFYYYVPGPDTFFRNLLPAYFSGGFINSPVFVIYPWAGFFLLIRMLSEITTLPLNLTVSVFYFGTGFVIASMLFFIATRHGFDGFWSVVTFSIIGFFFLNYQFAPETLAIAFLMILFYIDYLRRKSFAGIIIALTIVVATVVSHAFVLAYYAVYLLVRSFQDRRYLIIGLFAITLALISDMFLTYSVLSGLVLSAFNSVQLMLGFIDYGGRINSALTNTSPFVTFARLSVLSATAISAVGLIHLIGKRRALPQDIALISTSTLAFGIGTAVAFFGSRAIQLALVVAALGTGHFPELLHKPRVRVALLLFLSISSVFCVMHLNYSPLLYQNQEDARAAGFLSAKLQLDGRSWSNRLRIFTPYILRGFFGLTDNGNASIRVFFNFNEVDPTSMDYVLAPTATPAFAGSTYLPAKTSLTSRYNIIFDYGDGVIYAAILTTT